MIPGAGRDSYKHGERAQTHRRDRHSGEFKILAVPRGDYTVTDSAKGFQTQSAAVTVIVTTTQTVIFQLSPAGASTTVQVTAAAPLVDTSDATIGATIEGEQVTELPLNGRNFTQLALLDPRRDPWRLWRRCQRRRQQQHD